MVKIIIPASKKKREPPGMLEGQQKKRRKMDRSVKLECGKILKTLMTHKFGWGFNTPVEPEAYGIPDYFSIISHPMDLGTIKGKLEDNLYFDDEEFAADVRLTFTNSIRYNPPLNDFHLMAKKLLDIFSTSWKSLEAKGARETKNAILGFTVNGRTNNTKETIKACNSLVPETAMSFEEKRKLRRELVEASTGKMTERLLSFLQKYSLVTKEKIENNFNSLDDKTLWELKRTIKGSSDARAAKMEPANVTQNGKCLLTGKTIPKDNADRSSQSSVKTKPPLSSVSSNCGPCASVQNDSANGLSSDLSSENLFGQHHGISKRVSEKKGKPTPCMSRPDPDSDGAVSTLDSEHFFSSPRLSTHTTTAASEEEWNLLIDVQLSPKKALRAAMLKSRFADTILKAKQKTLLDQGKLDPARMQQEKQRLERQQLKEKTKIEAQIKAHIKAKADLQIQRERQREELDKMERTIVLDDNLKSLRDVKRLCCCPYFDLRFGKPLEQLGLYLKEECLGEYEDDATEMEDGEIPQ